jgi:hypothetical protein
LNQLDAIVIDQTYAYWISVNSSPNAIMKVPLVGGSVTTLASFPAGPSYLTPVGITVDSNNVYWTAGGQSAGAIQKVPLSGGTATTYANTLAQYPVGIVVDSSKIYWADYGVSAVRSMPLSGSSSPTTIASNQNPSVVVIDTNNIYWNKDYYNPLTMSNPGIMKAPLAGGTPTMLVTNDVAQTFTIDATNVYWISTQNSLKKIPIAGGATTTLANVLVSQQNHFIISTDGTNVYWVNDGASGGVPARLIQRVSVGGGSVTTVVNTSSTNWVGGIALSATSIFYTQGGLVYKVSK